MHRPAGDTSHLKGSSSRGWCTVVIPCFQEAARLKGDSFLEFLTRCDRTRFLFVNDGSTDGTLDLLEGLATASPAQIQVLDLQPNRGKGEAVRVGLLEAARDSDLVGFWDADLATPLDAIPTLRARLEEDDQLQMVIGARVRLLGRNIRRKTMRHYAGRAFATAASLVLRLPIYDTQCGAKLFRVTPDLLSVLQPPFLSRWIFDVELIARFLSLHAHHPAFGERAIFEEPLQTWCDVSGSKIHAMDFVTSFSDLLRIRRRYFS